MKVLLVIGTRPEAIKLVPVYFALSSVPGSEVVTCMTGQHKELVTDVLNFFDVPAHIDLGIMQPNQTITDITVSVLRGLVPVLEQHRPDWVVVQGDTTSTFAAALASFYARIRSAHVEAGLRTANRAHPWPEEVNRLLTSALCDRHFPPTKRAQENLLREGHAHDSMIVTGNTVVDALILARERIRTDATLRTRLSQSFQWINPKKRMILITAHRRESFGQGLAAICQAIAIIAKRHDVSLVFPVHPNPTVRSEVVSRLSHCDNVHLIEPVSYGEMIYLLESCHLVLTDSGGIQEEAPTFGKPVLVMRETTERVEAIEAGVARLVTLDRDRIVAETKRLLEEPHTYATMSRAGSPFGDGHAAERIARNLASG